MRLETEKLPHLKISVVEKSSKTTRWVKEFNNPSIITKNLQNASDLLSFSLLLFLPVYQLGRFELRTPQYDPAAPKSYVVHGAA